MIDKHKNWLDPHWLKERFKHQTDQELEFDLMFAINLETAKVIKAELDRRNEKNEIPRSTN